MVNCPLGEFITPHFLEPIAARYVYASIVMVGDRIVFISMFYADVEFDYSKLKVFAFGRQLVINERLDARLPESCILLIYTDAEIATVDEVTVEVVFEECSRTYKLKKHIYKLGHDHSCTLMTMLRGDYMFLKPWMEYYSRLGVTHFILYFNKKIDVNIENYIRQQLVGFHDRLTIFQCDLNYWNKYAPEKVISRDLVHNKQAAQMFALNDMLFRFESKVRSLLHVDLDEYIILHRFSTLTDLAKYLTGESDFTFLRFKHFWSSLGSTPQERARIHEALCNKEDALSLLKTNKIKINANSEGLKRTKCLVNLQNIKCMGIHVPRIFDDEKLCIDVPEDEAKLCHIINLNLRKYSERERLICEGTDHDEIISVLSSTLTKI